ncbi:alkaline phosphatase D [Kineococcus radiotolerans]|uniref:Alkaline phosphatase D n=1 Tax=Kineococcus radiotolerans TaxID=131568 RepID=A0A7W4TMK0_KINRA|nr:alkaline phosphatase D family protein [Kineococcus radiotolerans]MBB2901242.1 alkaline phosphatase D [Kineococcus radiotolerans]
MTSPTTSTDRRRFLAATGAVAGLAAATSLGVSPASASSAVRREDDPFTLGIASGDPAPDGFVLWTRLAPDPFTADGGMGSAAVRVEWRVCEDEAMRREVARGRELATPELAHSVHVEVHGLRPDREYFYQFRYQRGTSPVGRTRTLPAPWACPPEMRFAFVSCQDHASGYYPSFADIAAQDLDVVVHLGDYVYEGDVDARGGYRDAPVPEPARAAPRTLEQWRYRYALYKSDPQLRAAHARHPFVVTWDDHEVVNDYAGTAAAGQPDLSDLRAAAYQAYYEHQPLRRRSIPTPRGGLRLHRGFEYGTLAAFNVLDGRQYRDVPAGSWGEGPEVVDPGATMLGHRQERWLDRRLRTSRSRWNVLGNNVMVSRLDHDGPTGDVVWHDAWDGYPAARERLTRSILDARVRNPVFITGDWHSTFVNDVHTDFDRPDSPVFATEFVGTSISSNGDREVYGPYYGPMIGYNPHIRFFDGDRRGYVRCTLTAREWRTELRMTPTVSTPDAPTETWRTFVVEDGVPGAQEV